MASGAPPVANMGAKTSEAASPLEPATQIGLLPGVCRIGIDPGVTGAIAVVDDDKVIAAIDMPTTLERNGRRIVHGEGLLLMLRRLRDAYGEPVTYIERQQAMVGNGKSDGAVSAFALGQGYGILRMAVAAARLESVIVSPNTWKARAGLRGHPQGKIGAITVAKNALPNSYKHLGRNRERNIARCEAMLIGFFGYERKQQKVKR